MERSSHLDFGGAHPCDAIRDVVFWLGIFHRLHLACARSAGRASRFHHDDLLCHPVDPGGRTPRSLRGGWFGNAGLVDTRHLGYAYPLHCVGSWIDGGDVRGGEPSAVSHVPLSLIAAATFQCLESDTSACRPLCAGHSLYAFHFGIGYGTTGLRI